MSACRWCPECWLDELPLDAANCPRCETPTIAGRRRRRPGKPRGKWGKLNDEQLRAAHRLHTEAGLSIRELGRRLYKRHGFASAKSCAMGLSEGFQRLALPARGRIEATVLASTVHGHSRREMRANNDPAYRAHRARLRRERGEVRDVHCTAATKHGRPCQHFALAGSVYCFAHDPARAAERNAILEHARAQLARAA